MGATEAFTRLMRLALQFHQPKLNAKKKIALQEKVAAQLSHILADVGMAGSILSVDETFFALDYLDQLAQELKGDSVSFSFDGINRLSGMMLEIFSGDVDLQTEGFNATLKALEEEGYNVGDELAEIAAIAFMLSEYFDLELSSVISNISCFAQDYGT